MPLLLNLDSSVRRVRVGRWRRGRVGETTLQATACEAATRRPTVPADCRCWSQGTSLWLGSGLQGEQRRMARQAQCHRVRSALTQKVNLIEDKKVKSHAGLPKSSSGQLPFLGSMQL